MKFEKNGIISLLEVNHKYNLAESTAQDLYLGDIISQDLMEEMIKLRLGYGTSKGNEKLRTLIADKLNLKGEQVLITAGGMNAILYSLLSLSNDGDEIVTLSPNFPYITNQVDAKHAVRKSAVTSFDQGYKVNAAEILSLISAKTKVVIICTPQNPSGKTVEEKTILEILAVMKERCPEARIVIDETYREATYGADAPQASFAGTDKRILTISSLSKCHGAPGIRIGWLTCTDDALMEDLVAAKLNSSISCSVVDEFLALAVLTQESVILTRRRQDLKTAVMLLTHWMDDNSKYVEWVKPDAGGLCCIRLKADVFEPHHLTYFRDNLRAAGLQLALGEWFGESPNVFRLGFGFLDIDTLNEALEALAILIEQTLLKAR